MKLITIQHPDVINQLNSDGIYYPDPNKNMLIYDEIFEQYYKEKNIFINAAVWAFYSIDKIKCDKLDNIILGKITSCLPFFGRLGANPIGCARRICDAIRFLFMVLIYCRYK